jgi:hypothetical protein
MSKPSKYRVTEKVKAPEKEISERATQAVRLMIDANVKVTGSHSGDAYLFTGAGSVVDVDEKDVEELLAKRQGGRQCCGGTGYGNVMFELVEVT